VENALREDYGSGQHVRKDAIGRWSVAYDEATIERVRKLLPKIKNGRKTRYQKQKNKPQAKKPVPHKKKN